MLEEKGNIFLEVSASFDLNHDRLAADSKSATIAARLNTQSRIDSRKAFNRYCRRACLLWSERFSHMPVGTSAFFTELLERADVLSDVIIDIRTEEPRAYFADATRLNEG